MHCPTRKRCALLYHPYREPDVVDDLNSKAQAHDPLPALQQAYTLLGADWRRQGEADTGPGAAFVVRQANKFIVVDKV